MNTPNAHRLSWPQTFIKTFAGLLLVAAGTMTAAAQKSAALDALSKHGVDAGVLDAAQMRQPDNFAYDLTFTSTAAGKTTTTAAKYDPSASGDERWTVVSVNGKSPSRMEVNSFRKDHSKPKPAEARPADASYKVEKETADQLIISYKHDPATISKDASFMKDCRSYLTINLLTKRVEQVEALNEKPVKINILNADRFDLTVKYVWNEQAKQYLTVSEHLEMDARFMGQAANVETLSVYSNYAQK